MKVVLLIIQLDAMKRQVLPHDFAEAGKHCPRI
ncbi:hypothetical protein swp_3503 [Shewanella piezotolerans WP3]|uniref:Uncharacterized protein n=1 Tax=Shewanella piezotolerans (strain WP3 / JCM 13877) TaxID=225849 RepID=B8CQ68_SHEPW|nr:hypothetical protein swp_3503 [Shewanella piezotolerans WP3]